MRVEDIDERIVRRGQHGNGSAGGEFVEFRNGGVCPAQFRDAADAFTEHGAINPRGKSGRVPDFVENLERTVKTAFADVGHVIGEIEEVRGNCGGFLFRFPHDAVEPARLRVEFPAEERGVCGSVMFHQRRITRGGVPEQTFHFRDFRNRVVRAFLPERVPERKQSGKQDDCRFDQNPFVERHGAPRVTLYFKIHVLSAFFNRQTKKRRMEIQFHAACGYRLASGIIFSHSA